MASEHRRAVGVFPNRPKTASALQTLSDSGFSMSNVSVIAKDAEKESAIAGVGVKDEIANQADTGGAVGAVAGGVLGGVSGLLVGLGTLTIPGLGPALLAGEAATAIATVVGAAGGAAAGGLVGALVGLGIPEHRAKHYQDRVANGDYLVMLKGTEPELARAERTLKAAGIEDWGIYHPTNGADAERETRSTGLPYHSNPLTNGREQSAAVANSRSTATLATEERRAVGIFRDRHELETALAQLKQTGFPMHALSIAVRENDADSLGRERSHALAGAASLTSGLNQFDLPEVGSTLVMGPDSDAISTATDRQHSHSLSGILESLGIAHEASSLYSRHLADGAYLVTLRGRNEALTQAASTLGNHGMHDWGIYDIRRI